MPSPFPGSGPYLEGQEWRGVHTQLPGPVGQQLVPLVRPPYVVRTEKVDVPEG